MIKYLKHLFLFILMASSFSSCAIYSDINLEKVKIGMTINEVVKVIGHNSRNFVTIRGQSSTDSLDVEIYQYGKNVRMMTKDRSSFLPNPNYKPIDSMQEKYWFFFFRDRLVQVKWGNSNEWDSQADMYTFLYEMVEKQKSAK